MSSRPAVPTKSPATLVAAAILQAGQALLWVIVGLVLVIGYHGARLKAPAMVSPPVAVVLVIAAILAFAIAAFMLALAAGTVRRSDVCRIASVITQCVFGTLILAGTVRAIQTRAAVTLALDPAAGPAIPLTPVFIAVLLVSCVGVAALLLCRQSTGATRARYRRRYR